MLIGLEISDAGILAAGRALPDLLAVDGPYLESPGFAIPEKKRIVAGRDAQRQAHIMPQQVNNLFWEQLSTEPVKQAKGRPISHAEMAYAHLNRVWDHIKTKDERLVLAVPGFFTKDQLGIMLGILMEMHLSVAGMVSLAVAGMSKPGSRRLMLHLDIHLHRTVVTYLEQGTQLVEKDSVSLPGKGLELLYTEWANAVAQEFLRITRFDPFHKALTEQELYNRLPELLNNIQENPAYDFELSGGGRTHRVTISRSLLVQKGESLFWEIRRVLNSMRVRYAMPGKEMTIHLTHRVNQIPGVAAMLRAIPDTEVVTLAPGAAAKGAIDLEELLVSHPVSRGVSFLTSKPWTEFNKPIAVSPMTSPELGKQALCSTHVLYGNLAYPLSEEPLVIGNDSRLKTEGIWIDEKVGRIAARHCSIELKDDAATLRNYSPDGTCVNTERVDGTFTLSLGQVVKLGTPEQELKLIACIKPQDEKTPRV